MKNFLKCRENILFLIILSLLISATYIPSFSGQFILDDKPLVKNNLLIRKFNNLTFYLFQEDGVSEKSPPGYHTGYYRPLINLFYTIDYEIWGMNPSGFRTTNLLMHIVTCIVLYQILRKMMGTEFIPFSVTLLFGLHPINTESVAFISARNNILVTLFSLISFYDYLKYSREKGILVGLFSYFSFAMVLLCKEFAIMLLPIFFFYNRILKERTKDLNKTNNPSVLLVGPSFAMQIGK